MFTFIFRCCFFHKGYGSTRSAKTAPLDRILVETDAPYLTPKPYRGHQNETGYVRYVAEAIAKLKDIPLEKVADATYKNTVRVYGLNKKNFDAVIVVEGKDDTIRLKNNFSQESRQLRLMDQPYQMKY